MTERAARWGALLSIVGLATGGAGFLATLASWPEGASVFGWLGLVCGLVATGLAFQGGRRALPALVALALCVYVLVRVHEPNAEPLDPDPNDPVSAQFGDSTASGGQHRAGG